MEDELEGPARRAFRREASQSGSQPFSAYQLVRSLPFLRARRSTQWDRAVKFPIGQCTFLYDFDAITGAIDLGILSPGETLAINYFMTAKVSGPATFSGAIAALNDPFSCSDDALPPVPSSRFTELTPVPAPTSALLFGPALLVVARRLCRAGARNASA